MWPPVGKYAFEDTRFPTKWTNKEFTKGAKDGYWRDTGKLKRGRNELIASMMSMRLKRRFPDEWFGRKFISSHLQVLKKKFWATSDGRPADLTGQSCACVSL